MSNLVSIIVPAFNEEQTITSALTELLELDLPGFRKEIVVVNDGSLDRTRERLEPFLDRVLYCEHEANRGKGASIRTGMMRSHGDFIAIQDADLEYSSFSLRDLLTALQDDSELSAVYGSRNLGSSREGYAHYRLGAAFLTRCLNMLYGSSLTDVFTCQKILRVNSLDASKLKSERFDIEMEITARLLGEGKCIREIPITYTARKFAHGKKIRTMDGIRSLVTLARCRFLG